MPDATPARRLLPCPNDGWGILADPPGTRDLVQLHYWEASLERSRRRRLVRRQPRVLAGGRARMSLALTTAALSWPAAGVASADVGNLARGSQGPAVRELQRELGIRADGIFGPQTERSVRAFQRTHHVPATGLVGPLTRAALEQAAPSGGIATSASTAVSATTHGVMTHPIRSGYWGSHFVGARRLG